jgi:hypothetical protein
MSDLPAIADRVEIEALRGEHTDAAMTRDFRAGGTDGSDGARVAAGGRPPWI